jgi:hypothetical protein
MSRFAIFLVLVGTFGCGINDRPVDATANSSSTGAATTTVAGEAVEEFEGVVELFGRKLRARRQVKLDEEGNYVNHGQAVAWYETGQKAGEMAFHDGRPQGEQRLWHENGKKKLTGRWEDGQAVGQWTEWYENGQMMSEGSFVDGQKHGVWRFFNDDGGLREEVPFDHGARGPVVGHAPSSNFR